MHFNNVVVKALMNANAYVAHVLLDGFQIEEEEFGEILQKDGLSDQQFDDEYESMILNRLRKLKFLMIHLMILY
jgi:hypothetical protein